jgi:hypothetical protein
VTRRSRTFKLHLSPAGMDLLIEAHCHLIRQTRQLLAWGTTLQLAVLYLETVPLSVVADRLDRLPAYGFTGSDRYFLGAPRELSDAASAIAERVMSDGQPPTIASIYLIALQQLLVAESVDLIATLDRARRTTAARIGPQRI